MLLPWKNTQIPTRYFIRDLFEDVSTNGYEPMTLFLKEVRLFWLWYFSFCIQKLSLGSSIGTDHLYPILEYNNSHHEFEQNKICCGMDSTRESIHE